MNTEEPLKEEGQKQRSLFRILSGLHASPERAGIIIKTISDGSAPHTGYYALISAASIIASLGLLTNSGAVVIGAMLVSPLMMPIFGISLGIVRGDNRLFFRALTAEASGVMLAIVLGMVFGALPILDEATPEIRARLAPNLLDLLVAVFAGLAGTWAVVDERISPVLPGVAISTAIIPPLCVSGIALVHGSPTGAWGAFLLFFSNFMAILLVSSLLFLYVGFRSASREFTRRQLLPRIYVTVFLFLVLSVFLTGALLNLMESRRRTRIARDVLTTAEGSHPVYSIMKIEHQDTDDNVHVVAELAAYRALSPGRIGRFEKEMSKKIGKPVSLMVRCILIQTVSSTGSMDIQAKSRYNGVGVQKVVHHDVVIIRHAEQVLREIFSEYREIILFDIDLLELKGYKTVVASVQSHGEILPFEVKRLEKAIQKRLDNPSIRLVIRTQTPVDVTSEGKILMGQLPFGVDQDNDKQKVIKAVRDGIEDMEGFFARNPTVKWLEDHWEIHTEVVGPRAISVSEVKAVEENASALVKKPVRIIALSKIELVVTGSTTLPKEDYQLLFLDRSIKGQEDK